MTPIRTIVAVGVLAALVTFHPAHAQTKAACVTAAATGQSLRDRHQLVAARDQFRICAQAVCPPAVQADCTAWSAEADRTIPTVVLSAKDVAGSDTADVAVSIDGTPTLPRLTGVSLPIDPGMRTFDFRFADGAPASRTLLVAQGQRDIPIAAAHPTTATVPPEATLQAPPPVATSNADSKKTLRTIGWAAGGVGIAGIGVGAVATALVVSDKSAASCTGVKCQDYGKIQSAQGIAPIAGAGFVGGGALVGASVVFQVLAKGQPDDAAHRTRASRQRRGSMPGAVVWGSSGAGESGKPAR